MVAPGRRSEEVGGGDFRCFRGALRTVRFVRAVTAANPPGGGGGGDVAGGRGIGGRNGAMEAPPERGRDQGGQRCPKGRSAS